MKNILAVIVSLLITMSICTNCRFAPKQNNGDTIAASIFNPPDKQAADSAQDANAFGNEAEKDSVDIFYIGSGSDRKHLQLVSYPGRRDTTVYGKVKNLKVTGSADYGHVVRVEFLRSERGDSLVSRVTEVAIEELQQNDSLRHASRK